MVIQSHKGPYRVHFDPDQQFPLNGTLPTQAHFIVDARVAQLYADELPQPSATVSMLTIQATEAAKSLDRFPSYVGHLVDKGLRRDHVLVAVGGGIIQDITCFLAATMLRGVRWRFYPTTLLAQADSCIGSKSSINCGDAKNILGTFTPPNEVIVAPRFLRTLDERDIRSGIGEMLKVHAIAGPDAFQTLADDYHRLGQDTAVMIGAIRRSLEIKQGYIERDEFDTGPRLVFNLGHSFGHAIEAATSFAVPHGIAVTIGLDMANWMSWQLGLGASEQLWHARHEVLRRNYAGFERHPVDLQTFLTALSKDKKNTGQGTATLILPDAQGMVRRITVPVDSRFQTLCRLYLEEVRCL